MRKIKVNLNCPIVTGKQISFMAPCSSYDAECLVLNGIQFTIADSDGVSVSGIRNVWNSGAIVSVIVNVESRIAFIQNANTNPYIEDKFLPQTQKLEENNSLNLSDSIPFYSAERKENERITLMKLREFMGVQSMVISVTTCEGAKVMCTDGATTLTNTGSSKFYVPNAGIWTVTATLGERTAHDAVSVTQHQQYNVDLRILSGLSLDRQPNVTTYYVDEQFNPEGTVVTAVYADGTTQDVTAECKFNPSVIGKDTNVVSAMYSVSGQDESVDINVTVRALKDILITTKPNKIYYAYGDSFDPTGMVVTAVYTDGSTRVVDDWTYTPTGELRIGNTVVLITYLEGDVVCAAEITVIVNDYPVSLRVNTPPHKTFYYNGDSFDPTGMVVTVTMATGTEKNLSRGEYSVYPTIMMPEQSEVHIQYTDYGITVSCTQPVEVTTIYAELNKNDWATIRRVSDEGNAANLWNIGDTKEITIKGTVVGHKFDMTLDAFIIGFNHNAELEGDNRIHFQIGKIKGVDVALCDSYYPHSGPSSGMYFAMCLTDDISLGWKDSHARITVLGNNSTPKSPLEGSLLAALSSELRSVMKSVVKYSYDGDGYSAGEGKFVYKAEATTDYLSLPAPHELDGHDEHPYNENKIFEETVMTAQYDYYKAGNSLLRHKHNELSTVVSYWTRHASINGSYTIVDNTGERDDGAHLAHGSHGLAPIFYV